MAVLRIVRYDPVVSIKEDTVVRSALAEAMRLASRITPNLDNTQGTEAMRTKMIAAGLVALMGMGTVGCKTASKMAWWKTAENANADTAVLAHSAPTLPSEVARQADTLASTEVNITAGGEATGNVAAPFVPSVPPVQNVAPTATNQTLATTAPQAYPSTGASSFVAPPAQTVAVATPDPAANLGSVAMPYNPNAVPAPTPAQNATSTPVAASSDRYASTAAPSGTSAYNPAPAATAYSAQGSGSRYSGSSAPPAQTVAAAPAVSTPTAPPVVSGADRYGSALTPPISTAPPVNTAPPALAQSTPITPTPNSVAAAPYRPGGTSDYPTQAALEVASRPASSSPEGNATAAPGTSTPPAPRYR